MLAILLSGFSWFTIPPLRFVLPWSIFFSVLIQEGMRYVFYKLLLSTNSSPFISFFDPLKNLFLFTTKRKGQQGLGGKLDLVEGKVSHRPTRYNTWKKEGKATFLIEYKPEFEPYLVVHKSCVLWDERFVGYGMDKVTQSFVLVVTCLNLVFV